MIGSLPVYALTPLEYRYALDAAMILLGDSAPPRVYCNLPQLTPEVDQRTIHHASFAARSALWVEPLVDTWEADLHAITAEIPKDGRLVVVASQPLARFLPERRRWDGTALGMRVGGIGQLRRTLQSTGWQITQQHGIHSFQSIVINAASSLAQWGGRPDIADRLLALGRLHYRTSGLLGGIGTIALLGARKERP